MFRKYILTIAVITFLAVVVIAISPFVSLLKPIHNKTTHTVNSLSILITGKTPFEWRHPFTTIEQWIVYAKKTPMNSKISFRNFHTDHQWTHVCIFKPFTTDAEFQFITQTLSTIKLSDKSKVTTQQTHTAIAFINQKTKSVMLIYDIAREFMEFDQSVNRKCISKKNSDLRRISDNNFGI